MVHRQHHKQRWGPWLHAEEHEGIYERTPHYTNYTSQRIQAGYDQTVSLLIATANIVLATVLILCLAVNRDGSETIKVYGTCSEFMSLNFRYLTCSKDYEVLTAFSVAFLFAFRLTYSRRINSFI